MAEDEQEERDSTTVQNDGQSSEDPNSPDGDNNESVESQETESPEAEGNEEPTKEPLTPEEKKTFERMRDELKRRMEDEGPAPKITPEQKAIVEKAQKSSKQDEVVGGLLYKIQRKIKQVNFWFKTIVGKMFPSGLSSGSVVAFIGVVLLMGAVCLGAFLSGSAFGGIKGDKFYGLRTIYEDEQQATTELLEEYYGVIEESVSSANAITTITTTDTFNLTLTIQPTLLEQDFSFEDFEEESFKTENAELYSLIKQIADKVYQADNEGGSAPTGIEDTLKGVKYFGFNETLNTDIKTLVADYIKTHYTFEERDDKTVPTADINTEIDTRLNTVFDQEKYKTRTEKLFIKDYIYTSSTSYTEELETLNYKAHIFMAKEQVNFTGFHFVVSKADFSTFNMLLSYNSEKIDLDKSVNKDYGNDVEAYNYKTGLLFSKQIEAYNYVELPEERVSFYDLIGTGVVESLLKTNEETSVLEMDYEKENALILKFEQSANQPFLSIELETKYDDKIKES